MRERTQDLVPQTGSFQFSFPAERPPVVPFYLFWGRVLLLKQPSLKKTRVPACSNLSAGPRKAVRFEARPTKTWSRSHSYPVPKPSRYVSCVEVSEFHPLKVSRLWRGIRKRAQKSEGVGSPLGPPLMKGALLSPLVGSSPVDGRNPAPEKPWGAKTFLSIRGIGSFPWVSEQWCEMDAQPSTVL